MVNQGQFQLLIKITKIFSNKDV